MSCVRGSSYIIKSKDTLFIIAQQQLGDGNRWREILKPDGIPFIAGVMAAAIFTLATCFIGALEAIPRNYLWFIIGCGAFIAVVLSLVTEFSATARGRNGRLNSLFLIYELSPSAILTV